MDRVDGIAERHKIDTNDNSDDRRIAHASDLARKPVAKEEMDRFDGIADNSNDQRIAHAIDSAKDTLAIEDR